MRKEKWIADTVVQLQTNNYIVFSVTALSHVNISENGLIITAFQERLCGSRMEKNLFLLVGPVGQRFTIGVIICSLDGLSVGAKCSHSVLCLSIIKKSAKRAKVVHWVNEEKNNNPVAKWSWSESTQRESLWLCLRLQNYSNAFETGKTKKI